MNSGGYRELQDKGGGGVKVFIWFEFYRKSSLFFFIMKCLFASFLRFLRNVCKGHLITKLGTRR